MAFIGAEKQGVIYAPGHFLVHEECVRKTREIAQDSALVQITETGKYVPTGTAWPTNDANAVGILYEDVDVTDGNMPGSVVLSGVVIEDRLAITGESYSSVTPASGDNPAEKGWYERSGSSPNYVYTLTDDTTVTQGTTYYAKSDVRLASAAKTALTAKGFTFVPEPAVTRPY